MHSEQLHPGRLHQREQDAARQHAAEMAPIGDLALRGRAEIPQLQ